jgi:hypothetical protein
MGYERLDEQLARFEATLATAARLDPDEARKVATTIAAEVRFLDAEARSEVLAASPVPLSARIDELMAFQRWMELASGVADPAVTRAQVIVQNYVCFVYLSESCFKALRKVSRPESVTRRCAVYLTDHPVRSFRNAIAHANWTYSSDFSKLVFWARRGTDPGEPLSQFSVPQVDLDFWQALSRTVAYAAFTSLEAVAAKRPLRT